MSKYRPQGRDIILLKLTEKCAEVIEASSKVMRNGVHDFIPNTESSSSIELMGKIIDVSQLMEEVRKELPRPPINYMSSVVKGWFKKSEWRDQEEFLTTDFDRLIVFHGTIGKNIRNYFNLWQYPWKPEVVDGIDMSKEHPDSISMRVIEKVWRDLKNESTEH